MIELWIVDRSVLVLVGKMTSRDGSLSKFRAPKNHEIQSRDYRIRVRERESGTVIIAPHGGRIERGTSQIAEAVAGNQHTFYAFEGLKSCLKSNRVLHITSDHFDEPTALALITRAERVIAIMERRALKPRFIWAAWIWNCARNYSNPADPKDFSPLMTRVRPAKAKV